MHALRYLTFVAVLVAVPRAVMGAGACTASLDNDTLVVTCDDDDNAIAITEIGRGIFEITGDDDTTVNGDESAIVAGAIVDVLIEMAGGEDVCEIEEAVIPGTLTMRGGDGFTELAVVACEVGEIVVENGDGGSETAIEESAVEGDITIDNRDGFDEAAIEATEVGGSVLIDNHDGDPLTGEGSETKIEAEAVIWGDVIVNNKSGIDEFALEEATVHGDVRIDNGDGDELTGLGSDTSAEADAFIGGDLIVINKDGFDEFALEDNVEIAGSLWIANQSGGSLSEIERSAIGQHMTIDGKGGFDALSLDETAIGGGLHVTPGPGGSDFLTVSTTGSESVTVGGNLFVDVKGGGIDTATLRALDVSGTTSIQTGPGDDVVDATGSSFSGFSSDGHANFDTFMEARNSFPGNPGLRRFESVGPAGLALDELNETETGFDGGGAPREIPAIDPAGITWHAPSGHLFVSDSEIEEVDDVWDVVGANVFEISASGDTLFAMYDLTALGNDEPSGITYNEFDGHFYITNDGNQTVTRYSFSPGPGFAVDDVVNTEDTAGLDDPEGITSDPATGLLYVIDGHTQTVAIYEHDGGFALVGLIALGALNHPADVPRDPEGIAYDACSGHLLLVSDIDEKIYEYTLAGALVARYDLGGVASVIAPQGLAAVGGSVFVADGGVDNNIDENERDGWVYEVGGICP